MLINILFVIILFGYFIYIYVYILLEIKGVDILFILIKMCIKYGVKWYVEF